MVLSSVLSHGEQGMDVPCMKGAALLTLLTGPFPVLPAGVVCGRQDCGQH